MTGTRERNEDMLRRIEEGQTYSSVAARHMVCIERVRQIVKCARQKRELHGSHPVYEALGTRAVNGLRNLGVDPTDVRQISAIPKNEFAATPNIGKVAVKEVTAYLLSLGVEWR